MANKLPDWDSLIRPGDNWASLLVAPESVVDDLVRTTSENKNMTVRIVRGHRCSSKEQLFQEWAAALQFPFYFGGNWDAFEDCLTDRDWLPGEMHVVVLTSVTALLHGRNGLAKTFWDIVRNAALDSHGTILRIILQTEPKEEQATRRALEKLGIKA